MKQHLYIGLMSGTSMDGVDAVIADFSTPYSPLHIAHYHHPYPQLLRDELLYLAQAETYSLQRIAEFDVLVGEHFASSALNVLQQQGFKASDIVAIGSHGQTIRHRPEGTPAFTWQLGDPNIIVARTQITTVADFRRQDIAQGGQGAPLTPLFHPILFNIRESAVILNIGGIANITYLPFDTCDTSKLIGLDTGPGNTLLDLWVKKHLKQNYDVDGQWASSSTVNSDLLAHLKNDPFFTKLPPKSTGTDYFSEAWLEKKLQNFSSLEPSVVQTTLSHFTALTISDAILQYCTDAKCVIVCGGGAYNNYLIQCLKSYLAPQKIQTSLEYDIDPECVEGMTFAWLAHEALLQKSQNLQDITGSRQPLVLGGIYSKPL